MNKSLHTKSASKKFIKRSFFFISVIVLLTILTACGSSAPCESCGDTPTKGYMNSYHKEKEYYCKDCSSNCEFCSDKATEHYTSGFGIIVFACDDCYKEIKNMNS